MVSDNHIERGHALRIAVGIIMVAILFAGNASATTRIVCPGIGVCDFSSINAAINAANSGDTIEVQSGTYYENVFINKKLNLKGVGSPIVDAGGNGNVFRVYVDGVTIDNFRMRNGSKGMNITSNNSVFSNNVITNITGYNDSHSTGIYMSGSRNNIFTDNKISNLTGGTGVTGGYEESGGSGGNSSGIYISASTNNTLIGNTISNIIGGTGGTGGESEGLGGPGGPAGTSFGIYLSGSTNNTLDSNTISNIIGGEGGRGGQYEGSGGSSGNSSGIYLSGSANNTLINNTISNMTGGKGGNGGSFTGSGGSGGNSFGIYLSWSIKNSIINNTINNMTGGTGGWHTSLGGNSFGIYLYNSTNNTFTGNTIKNMTGGTGGNIGPGHFATGGPGGNSFGIYISGSTKNTFTDNTISNMTGGVGEWGGIGGNSFGMYLSNSTDNTLNGNTINNMVGMTGSIDGGSGGLSSGIYISGSTKNSFTGNTIKNMTGGTGGIGRFAPGGSGGLSSGIYLSGSTDNIFTENTIINMTGGIGGTELTYFLIGGGSGGLSCGIYLFGSTNNIFTENTFNNMTGGIGGSGTPGGSGGFSSGIYIFSSINNTLFGNMISNITGGAGGTGGGQMSNGSDGIGYSLYLTASSSNKIYNNFLNNLENAWDDGINYWNTTKTSGINIVGGPYIGGNFWANPNGTGFGQNCTDANGDGICDSPYVLDENNTDYLPLASIPIVTFINPTPVNGAFLAQNYASVNTTVSNALTAFIDWNHSLAGWWRFNNESGESPSFFRDWSSWGNNGTCSGTNCPASTSGKFGNGLNFDGVNDYVDAGNKASLNITGPITIEAWINPAVAQEKCWDGMSGNYGVMSKVSAAQNSVNWSWQLRYGAPVSGCYLGFSFNANPEGSRWVTVKQNLIPGQWYHIAGTFNGTDVKSYLNGDPKDTIKISAIRGYNNKLLIGTEGWANFFNGTIDEVRIHNRALSPEEIKASYDAGIYRLNRNFTNLAEGIYNYQANAQNVQGNVNQADKRILSLVAGTTIRFINGTVRDKDSGDALEGVTVSTIGITSSTNAAGFYSLTVSSGTYPITATYDIRYYTNSSIIVSTASSAVVVQDIELVKKPTGNISGLVLNI